MDKVVFVVAALAWIVSGVWALDRLEELVAAWWRAQKTTTKNRVAAWWRKRRQQRCD